VGVYTGRINMGPKISRCTKCQSELIVVMDESVPTIWWHVFDTKSPPGSGGNGVLRLKTELLAAD